MSAYSITPPVAPERPQTLEKFGDQRVDPYYWMRERENPEVIAYLRAENAYWKEKMAPAKALQEKVYEELRSRVKEDDSSVPFRMGPYFYYDRFETGKEYPIYARKKGSLEAQEEILLDGNEMAKGHTYFSLPFPKLSPDHQKLIYAVDTQGRRFYDLHVIDISSRKELDSIPATTGDAEWANDNQTFFYTKQDKETLRPQWAFRRNLSDQGGKKDELLFDEKDDTFFVNLSKSRTNHFLFLMSQSTLSHEWRFLNADQPEGKFEIFLPREAKHEYDLEDGEDGFYVVTNWKAKNFRLMKAPRRASKKEEWVEVVPNRNDVLLEGADFFRSHFAVEERYQGLSRIRVFDRKTNEAEEIRFPDPTYVVGGGTNEEYDAPFYRYSYQSLNRPQSIFDYDFARRHSELKKQKETPNLDPSQYVSERLWATAQDGTKIPVSLVHRKDFKKDGKAPLFQYAYGSYGFSMEPWFSPNIFSLVDRGFVYAIAHIRGGSEMGRYWYEDGKLLKKKNTFTDFIDCTEFLVKEGYGDRKRVYAQGGSAGGLLMGAVANLRPDLYRGMHAAVPFVDVLSTMLDDSIPLTTFEYDEWGNPNEKEYYDYMKSYSPYDNVSAKAYPNLLITSGLHDSQVQYWEPTKWAAKLRKIKTGDSLVLLRTEMEAGHGGVSGRFKKLKEKAEEYAFFLMLDGMLDGMLNGMLDGEKE
jgi:oligopeptidase B